MPLFQKSVLKRYIAELSQAQISNAYLVFQGIFNNPVKQVNILNSKEEQYQASFIRDLFVNVFGYILNPDVDYNLITEQKNEKDSKKADGAILDGLSVLAVIELKSTKTVDLSSVEAQAFGYKNNQQSCKYVVTSNFKKLRFYIDNAVDFEEFDLFNLSFEQFNLLWICLSPTHLLKNIPSQIKEASNHQEENVTKKLYADYAKFRTNLFQNIILNNPNFDKLVIFKKTQKLLDRFLFLFFAEDRGLVSPNWTRKILQDWTDLKDKYDNYIPLYNRFCKNFEYLNTGYSGKDGEIFAYNGGLFAPDEILDCLNIDDAILYNGSLILSNYDFESEVDVNILGHIFEHSLNEIDEIQASLEEIKIEKVTKRKKDGVFYTPKYITKYIVENTIGVLCKEQKEKLEIRDEEFEFIDAKTKGKDKIKREILNQKIIDYRNWLLELKIVDPACGSGAFLNQALEFLISEHTKLDELKATLLGGSLVLSDVENSILENNLYGVDINEEAVEIAKLSLWLRTARKGRKLNSLNQNLKCGNSLIDDVEVAGEKAFNWNNEFKEVFENGGFDVVIGNPPYTYRNAISDLEKNYFKINYKSIEGNFDLYKLFIEKLVELTKVNGFASMIVPNTFLSASTYKKLREVIYENFHVKEFFDLGLDVFENVVVESIIFNFKKSKTNNNETIIKIDREREGNFFSIETEYEIDLGKYYKLDKAFNINISKNLDEIISKIQLNTIELGLIAYCTVGINTGYIKNELTSIEKINAGYHKMLNGKNIGRNFVEWGGDWIMYDAEFVKSKGDRGRSLPPEYIFIENKILIQRTRRGMKRKLVCYFDNERYYNLNRLSNVILRSEDYNLKYIYTLLNSELLDFYFNKYFNEYEVKPIHLSKLPIKIASESIQNKFSEKSDLIIELNKNLIEYRKQLFNILNIKFPDLIINKKLEKWDEMNWKEFFIEIGKQKLKFTLSEQAEWLNYFEEQKEKTLAIKALITQTDKEIDKMVYELYELTEEEIKIVEGNF